MKENIEERETNLVTTNNNQLQNGIFTNDDKTRKFTSLNLEDEEQADMLLNSLQDVDFKLNECIDKEITCVGCYIVEREVDSFNEETGEEITRKKHITMLFDEKGKSYVTGSNACYMSFNDIVSIKGMPTKEKPLKLKPIKVDAKEKGHSYLKIKICK